MVSAVLIVIGAWIVIFCVLAGIGQIVRGFFLRGRTAPPPAATLDNWFSAFWIGYALTIAVLEGWHLLLPIDWRVTTLIGVTGLVCFVWAIRPRASSIAAVPRRSWPVITLQIGLQLLALLPISLWIASRALSAQVDFDTAMYHLSTLHWLNTYAVVPGIGNLHYRLAFNQSFFMFVAALNGYPFFDQGLHIANSLLMMVLIAQLINAAVVDLLFGATPGRSLAGPLLSVLLLPIVLYRAVAQYDSANMSSPSPDLSIFILQIVVSLALIRWLSGRTQNAHEQHFLLFFVLLISAIGLTSKLSFAAFGAASVALIVLCYGWQERQRLLAALQRVGLWAILIGAGLILPWIANGLISSGYPLFPSTFGALPVDYRVPAAVAIDAADWVRSFARDPHGDMQHVLNSWDWLPTWEANLNDNLKIFLFVQPFYLGEVVLALYGVLLLIAVVRRWRGGTTGPRRHHSVWLWLPLIPALLSAIFWFYSAPDPRFAGSVFWLLTLWLLTLVMLRLPASRWLARITLLPVLIMAAVIVANGLHDDFHSDGHGFPALPQVPITQFQTNSGLLVNVAANPDDTLELWDAPLPASPYKIPELMLRGTDLRDGFRTGPTVTATP